MIGTYKQFLDVMTSQAKNDKKKKKKKNHARRKMVELHQVSG